MSKFYPGTGGTGDSVPGHGQGLEQDWGLGPLVPAGTGRSVLAWCMGLPVPSPGLFVAWQYTLLKYEPYLSKASTPTP